MTQHNEEEGTREGGERRRGPGPTMATADSGPKPLQNAMKMAKVAIQLDGGSKHKEAYCEYLRTINYISHALLEEAGSQKEKEMVAVEGERMLRLAEQCLERAKSFIGKNADPPDLSASASASSCWSPGQSQPHQTTVLPPAVATNTVPPSDPPVGAGRKATSPTKAGHRRVLSDGGGELSPFLPPEVFQRLQTVESQDRSKKELTPIEEASRLNQKLKANYEARLARLTPETQRKPTTTAGSSVGAQSFSTDCSLSPSPSHDFNTNYDNEEGEEQVTVDRENSFEDLEQFLTQLDWAPPHGNMDDTCSDSELTCDSSMQPEQDEGHISELETRAMKEHLKAVVKDIHIAIDQLLSLCLLSFECLNTASSKDLCLASIEEAFFTPLWSALVALFSGADDLLPILSFVALRCQCPQLVSECAALEEFIHEGYLIGEEGYCLTSMQSALAYVESLHTAGTHLPADKFV
eukprot:superscaffoldBa00001682_g11606